MNKKTIALLFGVLIVGVVIGAVGAYVLTLYKTINAVDSLLDAPFGQGFYFGFGAGALVMYQHYEFPDVNSLESFEIEYLGDSNHFKTKFKEALENSILIEKIAEYVREEEPADAIYDWIMRSEERARRGIFGFTVQKESNQPCAEATKNE